jgi:hypothetical protein
MESTRKIGPTESAKQCSQGLTETEAASAEPAGDCTRRSVYVFWLFSLVFLWGFCESWCVLYLLSGLFSSCWVSLSRFSVRAFALSNWMLFCLFGFCLLEACSFLKGSWLGLY